MRSRLWIPLCSGLLAGVFCSPVFALYNATPTRTIGPFISGQVTPAPGGGWHSGDDRIVGPTIDGQDSWVIADHAALDTEVTTTAAHSGLQSWRLSNWMHNGNVDEVYRTVPASIRTDLNGSMSTQIWFRTASPSTSNSVVTSSISAGRQTLMGFLDDSNGVRVRAVSFDLADNQVDDYSPALTRGQWYQARVDAYFSPASPDLVRYRLWDAAGTSIMDITRYSWEHIYGGGPVSMISFRVAEEADTWDPVTGGSARNNGGTYTAGMRPFGFYFDDMGVFANGAQVFFTDFEAPEPASLALVGLGATLMLRRRRG